jgi:hypothetical protein
MAYNGAVLEISDRCAIASCPGVGLLVQNDVREFVRDSSIIGCDTVCAHIVDNAAPFAVERCAIGGCPGNGANVRSTAATFSE